MRWKIKNERIRVNASTTSERTHYFSYVGTTKEIKYKNIVINSIHTVYSE